MTFFEEGGDDAPPRGRRAGINLADSRPGCSPIAGPGTRRSLAEGQQAAEKPGTGENRCGPPEGQTALLVRRRSVDLAEATSRNAIRLSRQSQRSSATGRETPLFLWGAGCSVAAAETTGLKHALCSRRNAADVDSSKRNYPGFRVRVSFARGARRFGRSTAQMARATAYFT
jgi:hypothetical protein